MPKVVRFLSKKDIQEYSISKRCENLTVKWKQELEKGLVQKQKMPKLAVHDSVKTTAETAGGKVEEIESSAPINGEESLHPGNTEDSNQMSDSGAPVVSESGLEVEDANQLSNVDSAQDMHVSV